MSNNLTYTKAIKNGYLKTNDMAIGDSVTGTVTGFEDGKYGKLLLLNVNGNAVKVTPSGNLKFKVQDGELNVNSFYVITRKANAIAKKSGREVGQFDITEGQTQAPAAANPVSVKDKLQAIRNGTNA